MGLPGLLLGAVATVVTNKLIGKVPKGKRPSVGEALVGAAVQHIAQRARADVAGDYSFSAINPDAQAYIEQQAGGQLGRLLGRGIPGGKLERFAQGSLARILRYTADTLENGD